nr:498_t:CDS:2 [Entrophospora candida]
MKLVIWLNQPIKNINFLSQTNSIKMYEQEKLGEWVDGWKRR